MPRRTTVILEDRIYRALVEESVKRYGSAKALSKVINEILEKVLTSELSSELVLMLKAKRRKKVSSKEFSRFRRGF